MYLEPWPKQGSDTASLVVISIQRAVLRLPRLWTFVIVSCLVLWMSKSTSDELLLRNTREVTWLRGLIIAVAEGLERLAMTVPSGAGQLRVAAMWLRRALHQGQPPEKHGGIGVGSGPGSRK